MINKTSRIIQHAVYFRPEGFIYNKPIPCSRSISQYEPTITYSWSYWLKYKSKVIGEACEWKARQKDYLHDDAGPDADICSLHDPKNALKRPLKPEKTCPQTLIIMTSL
jgi:hypothetical protein